MSIIFHTLLCALSLQLLFDCCAAYGATIRPPIPVSPKCVYFTGAGIYYYWQAGAAKYLQETCDMSKLPVIGASAGSLTATLLLSGADFEDATSVAARLAKEKGVFESKTGLVGGWSNLVRDWLEEVIPLNVPMRNFRNLQIAVTPIFPTQRSELVSDFADRADLIDACMASCHVPFILDSKPYTYYRGRPTIDGSFYYFLTKDRCTGLPIPDICEGSCDDIFWVDYGDDEVFMRDISGHFMQIITPEGAYDMIRSGYNFMLREHVERRLPIADIKEPTLSNIVAKIKTIPKKMARGRLIQVYD
mmetsp:Transcript_18208/g.18267  ORF Transcript_18208/g.18267 Transcript_18208/m.18267 type:complete len:304 (+) Transcript_18208:94-1005(+)